MDKRHIIVKSKQFLDTHVDEIEEEHECLLEVIEKQIKIVYDNTVVIISKESAIIEKDNSKLVIQVGKRNRATYSTPYGNISIEIIGKEIKYTENIQMNFKITYSIKLGELNEYVNELQLLITEK